MAEVKLPLDVKLICGILTAHEALLAESRAELAKLFSPVELASDVMEFDLTHYYDQQMGSPLKRQFVAFAAPVCPDVLAAAKLATNELEKRFAARVATPGGPRRPINLDVGYVDEPKLVLASMKNFSHRVYLGRGVYGEVTLMFRGTDWQPLPWTFPDYASGRYHPFLTEVRDRLRLGRHGKGAREKSAC